jgi:hypothetical protein
MEALVTQIKEQGEAPDLLDEGAVVALARSRATRG